MFYRSIPETVFKGFSEDNETILTRYVTKRTKEDAIGTLNYMIETDCERNDYVLDWKRDDLNTTHEIYNRVPLYLNFLAARGYKKILFIGHFNAAQQVWHHPTKSDRIIHLMGSERWYQNRFVDMNIILQFLPIVKMEYGYTNFDMHVVKPVDSHTRHRHIMHSMYKRYGCDIIPGTDQYKHGVNQLSITPPPDTMYDAVVFAGVPKTESGTEFEEQDIRAMLSTYCKVGFDIIDLYYQEEDKGKFKGKDKEDVRPEITQVLANRGLWDNKFKNLDPQSRHTENFILENTIKVYTDPDKIYGIPEKFWTE
jgi:hypothetical protein